MSPLATLMQGTDEEAYRKAIRFIEYRARSTGETRDRLRKWGYGQETTELVLGRLARAGLLDDREFGRTFVEELVRKGLGSFRIRSELLKKRLDRELVECLMESLDHEEERERARAAAVRRYSALSGTIGAAKAREKTFAYLLRRGYSVEDAGGACANAEQVDTETGAELE